jgi:hypothetical protein
LTFNGLHEVISQKIQLFITAAVRTSNPILLRTSEFHRRQEMYEYLEQISGYWLLEKAGAKGA